MTFFDKKVLHKLSLNYAVQSYLESLIKINLLMATGEFHHNQSLQEKDMKLTGVMSAEMEQLTGSEFTNQHFKFVWDYIQHRDTTQPTRSSRGYS